MTEANSAGPSANLRLDWYIISWMAFVHLAALGGIFYFSWGALFTGFLLYVVTGLFGITLGYHRLLTHRSIKTPKWVERVLATCGVLALQGSPIEWVAHHRMHHAGSDTPKDPHNARRGFWFSHIGWLFFVVPEFDNPDRLRKFARDLYADPYMRWLSLWRVQLAIQLAVALPLLVFGGLAYLFWGVFVRLVFLYHATWLVNSAAHMWGYRRYEVDDLATNNWFVALFAFGEGWHNNHHAHADVAPAGRAWYEIDCTWYVICLMKRLGLVGQVNLPPARVRFDAPQVTPKDSAKSVSR